MSDTTNKQDSRAAIHAKEIKEKADKEYEIKLNSRDLKLVLEGIGKTLPDETDFSEEANQKRKLAQKLNFKHLKEKLKEDEERRERYNFL